MTKHDVEEKQQNTNGWLTILSLTSAIVSSPAPAPTELPLSDGGDDAPSLPVSPALLRPDMRRCDAAGPSFLPSREEEEASPPVCRSGRWVVADDAEPALVDNATARCGPNDNCAGDEALAARDRRVELPTCEGGDLMIWSWL